jgi:hypothetical protein
MKTQVLGLEITLMLGIAHELRAFQHQSWKGSLHNELGKRQPNLSLRATQLRRNDTASSCGVAL